MQTLKLLFLFSWAAIFSCAQKPPAPAGKMKWLSLDAAAAGLQKEKRPVLIDLYTGWCGWCKVMDKRTYGNAKVSAYVQEKFYPVKVDAESRQTLTWNGKEYHFNSAYKTNELALWLTDGQLSYPTTVFIPVDGEPQPVPGFLAPNEFELLVKYFGEGHFGKTDFEQYRRQFKSSW